MCKNYYYVYRITNTTCGKHYYGSRGCFIEPSLDLGVQYFSSSYDKEFTELQKSNPEQFKYKVIKTFDNITEALELEIKLHRKMDVGKNPNFYNKAKQTSTGFDQSGVAQPEGVKDKKRKPIINLDTREVYKGVKLAAELTGIQSRVIINVCKRRGNQTKAGGFHWAYAVEGADDFYYDELLQEIIDG